MPNIPDEAFLNLWYQALECEIGISVPVDNVRWALNELYRVRKERGDPELDKIILILPPGKEEVWLCKKTTDLGNT